MTEKAKAYLERYPDPEILVIEDQEGDPERAKLFNELPDEDAKQVLRHYGIKEKIIALAFD